MGIQLSTHSKLQVLPRSKAEKDELNKQVGQGWKAVEYSIEELGQHLVSGAGIGAIYKDGHRKAENFIASQIICLDFDHNVDIKDVLANPYITQFEGWIGNTISHTEANPRTRVILPLDKLITDRDEFKRLANKVLFAVEALEPDSTSNQAERFFHGIKNVVYNAGKPLSIADIEALPNPPAEVAKTWEAIGLLNLDDFGSSTQDVIRAIESKKEGEGNKAAFAGGFTIARNDDSISEAEIEQLVFQASVVNGYVDREIKEKGKVKAGENAVRTTIRNGIKYGLAAKAKTPSISQIKADLTINQQYITPDIFEDDFDVILQSDTGTGKTTAIAKYSEDKTIIAPNHRRSLSLALAKALGTQNYEGMPRLWEEKRLSIVVNSIERAARDDAWSRDIVALDEIDQLLQHFSSDLFDKSDIQLESVYNTFVALVKNAKKIIATSAHINPVVIEWLKNIRGANRVKVIVNEYSRNKGNKTHYQHKEKLIEDAIKVIDENSGCVVFPTSSIQQAKDLYSHLVSVYGQDEVVCVHSEIPDKDKANIIQNVETIVKTKKAFIYSPTIGSGIDIQTPVRLIAGIFYSEPLTSTDFIQMLERCRHTQETFVYIQHSNKFHETEANVIYKRPLESAIRTSLVAHFDAYGIKTYTDSQNELLKLLADINAYNNQQRNDLAGYFKSFARGYTGIEFNKQTNEDIGLQISAARDNRISIEKEGVLKATPIDDDDYDIKQQQYTNTIEDHYGHLRYTIEKASGETITSEIYDLLKEPEDRAKLYMLVNVLYTPREKLLERDREQVKHSIQNRKHYTRKVDLLKAYIQAVYGDKGLNSDDCFDKQQIEQIIRDFMTTNNEQEVYLLFDKRADESRDSVALFKWLFGLIGLEVASKKIRIDGKLTRFYYLEPNRLKLMKRIAAQNYTNYSKDVAPTDSCSKTCIYIYDSIHELEQNRGLRPINAPIINNIAI